MVIRSGIPFLVISTVLVLMGILVPASAYETSTFDQVYNFDAIAPQDMHIVTVQAGNIHNAGNHTFVLNSYGEVYLLEVDLVSVVNVWWEADITLTYPNGTKETKHMSQVAAAWDYDINVQFTYPDTDTIIDVDLYIGLKPLIAEWNAIPPGSQTNYIPFSEVSGTSTQPMDVTVWYLTNEEYTDVKEGNVTGMFASWISWTWDIVLDFIAAIPGIGPYFAALLEVTVMALGELFWYFNFLFIENIEITILTVEFFIIGHAMLSTSSLIGLLKRIFDDHVALYRFLITSIQYAISLVTWAINIATDIIKAIKPI